MKVYITDLTHLIKNDFSSVISKLSAQDTNRLERITDTARRLQFLVGRALIFQHFGSAFTISSEGKPIAIQNDRYLSLAHSHQYVVLAVSNTPVGIDIEKISDKRNIQAISNRLKFKNNLSLDEFYQAFTAYEADFKLQSPSSPYHQFLKWDDFMICISLEIKDNVEIIETVI